MDHSQAPVLEALQAFRDDDHEVFGPPGHKQGRGVDPRVLALLGDEVFRADVLLLNGLDDRTESAGVLTKAQDLMADAVGADKAFFSTCGSSLSVKSAMLAVAGPGEKLLISRNAHKSVISGAIVAGIDPVWVRPQYDPELEIAHPPAVEDVRRSLAEHPDARGMLLITPTDYGSCGDIRAIAELCHAADVPLIVDEAWGALFPFHDQLPTWGMDAGADVVVTSVHKLGGAVEQSSVFHLQGDRVDPYVLKSREDLLGTTSASSLVYLTLDGWRRFMVEQGQQRIERALSLAARLRHEADGLDGIEVTTAEQLQRGGAYEVDPLKVSLEYAGASGYQAAEWLRAEMHVDVGHADHRRFQAQLSLGDSDGTVDRLIAALDKLAGTTFAPRPEVRVPPLSALELETVMRPRDAYFARTEQVPWRQAVGRVAAEMATPYPPGVPTFCPGERLTADVLEYLRSGPPAGMLLPDPADASLDTVRVVA
jgi:arginine/lysine/ornithine decarboxylase